MQPFPHQRRSVLYAAHREIFLSNMTVTLKTLQNGRPAAQMAHRHEPMRINQAAIYSVRSTSIHGAERRMILSDSKGKSVPFRLPRFALVGPADKLYVDPVRPGNTFVFSAENPTDPIRVTPHFERRETVTVGRWHFETLVKEIVTESELQDYLYLEDFHYKTSSLPDVGGEIQQKTTSNSSGGRKAVLISYVKVGSKWLPAGYIELQMPLMMVKPRHVLFANPFSHPIRTVSWNVWNPASIKQHLNLIVRIARVVTSPDLRGLGLARTLISNAKLFAKERWHIGGKRPLFLEILAEMLKYMDFVSSSGLRLIGNTEGNLDRIHQDLLMMQRGRKISFGIMSLQQKYLTQLKGVAAELKKDFNEVLDGLKILTESPDEEALRNNLNTLAPAEWYLFRKALRFPIPYYMCGLDDFTDEYIQTHAPTPNGHQERDIFKAKHTGLHMRIVSVEARFPIPDSPHVRAIRECFGLDGETIRTNLLQSVPIEASAGNVIFVTGPSGSGKSILLKVLDPHFSSPILTTKIENRSKHPYTVAWMEEITSEKPLIEYFSEKWGIQDSILALNQAGLSEAYVYLKPYQLLSRGQRYRARLAALTLGRDPVWLIDEFCADLDPFTAKVVASSLRKHVIKHGRTAIVAAANYFHFIDALQPARVIVLRQNATPSVLGFKEFLHEYSSESN